MTTSLHFISGLPRAGSTLLSAILRQNPRFHAGTTSPVYLLCNTLHQQMNNDSEFAVFFDDSRRHALLTGLFNSFYADLEPDRVVFDTNRLWTGKMAMLDRLYPNSRIICCVREVSWIVDSIELMLNKHPLRMSRLTTKKAATSLYARVEALLNSESGLVGQPWATLREAWFGAFAQRLILIPYEHLTQDPARVIAQLYEALGEAEYPHNFENLNFEAQDYHLNLGVPGLHSIRPRVEHLGRQTCLPPDMFAKHGGLNFWTRPELNTRQVTVL